MHQIFKMPMCARRQADRDGFHIFQNTPEPPMNVSGFLSFLNSAIIPSLSFTFLYMPSTPLVAVLMGSKSDWDIMKNTSDILREFGVAHECHVLSAHRTPKQTMEFVSGAEKKGMEVIIAAAGGAAHLAGVCAAHTLLPVLGVPMESVLEGLDSLLSTAQMPAGIPVGTLAIGKAGAKNAAYLALAILALSRPQLKKKLQAFRKSQEKVAERLH